MGRPREMTDDCELACNVEEARIVLGEHEEGILVLKGTVRRGDCQVEGHEAGVVYLKRFLRQDEGRTGESATRPWDAQWQEDLTNGIWQLYRQSSFVKKLRVLQRRRRSLLDVVERCVARFRVRRKPVPGARSSY